LRYCLRYRFLPEGRRGRVALWLEDTGVCSIDLEGRPRLAQGTLRVINDRREREERLVYLGSHDKLTGQPNRTRLPWARVGDEKTAELLEKAGISYMQGYFFGAPELTKPEAAAKPAS